MRVLSVASECVPLVKTGGLADVVGALPGALTPLGVETKVLIPAYRGVAAKCARLGEVVWRSPDLIGGPAEVIEAEIDGLQVLLLDAPHFFDRDGGPYGPPGGDFEDNPERFAALCQAGLALAEEGLPSGWRPDVVHAHDWQAGLLPWLMRGRDLSVKSLLTIHNIAFQGLAAPEKMGWMGLDPSGYHAEGFEYWGRVSVLKAGLVAADAISTVSPTYASELMRPEFGMGLEGVLRRRAADLSGILNGTDTAIWDPSIKTDAAINPYRAGALAGKAANRVALCAEFGLEDVPGPLAIVVSRLTGQKGIDLLPEVLPEFLAAGGGLIVLGSGEAALEARMRDLAAAHPARIGVRIGYDESLSRRMFAGGDAVLVPSRFEPCGLTQMYGLRYGTLPVVAATGGLADTLIDANPAALSAGAATGITFHPTDAMAFAQALRRLVALYADRKAWRATQANAMRSDVAWSGSARAYAELYKRLVK